VTMSCLLGITIQCARCHEHKFEPIAHDEYYRLQAILYPVYCPDRWTKPNDRTITIGTRAEREDHARRVQIIEQQIKALEGSLQSIASSYREQLLEERLSSLDAGKRMAIINVLKTEKRNRSRDQELLVKPYEQTLNICEEDLTKRFADYAGVRDQLR